MKPGGSDGDLLNQPIKPMNWTKFLIAFIAAFVFIFAFGFLWYGTFLHDIHNEVPALWRTEADFGTHRHWLILGQIVMAFFLTMLFARFVPAGGVAAGLGLGIMVAFLFIGNDLIFFAVEPLTRKIFLGWAVGDLIEFAIAGAIIGAIYKPSTTTMS
jgi:hypothetical protein